MIVDGERYERLEGYLSSLRKGSDTESLHAVVVMPRIKTRRATSDDKDAWKGKEAVHDWDDLMSQTTQVNQIPAVEVDADDSEFASRSNAIKFQANKCDLCFRCLDHVHKWYYRQAKRSTLDAKTGENE